MPTCVTSARGEFKLSLEAPQDLLNGAGVPAGWTTEAGKTTAAHVHGHHHGNRSSLEPHKATALNKKPKPKQQQQETVLL